METGRHLPTHGFLFRVTLRRLDHAAEIYHLREPEKLPLVMSPDETKRLLAMVIFVTVSGRNKGQLVQETYANKIYSRNVDGRTLSAIQITTAAAICTVLDLLVTGELQQSGFVRQEDIPLKVFLENRFGRAYAKQETGAFHQHFGGLGR